MKNKVLKRNLSLLALFLVFAFILISSWPKNSMSASAEGAPISSDESTVAEGIESGFDLTQYPTANLIPYPYDNDNSNRLFYVGDEYTLRGVIFRFNIDGSISLFGTSTESFTFVFVSYKQFSLPVGFNYCISGGKDNVAINCWKRDVNGTSIVFASSANGNVNYGCINDGESFYRIGLSCKSGYEYNTTIYPMLNVGEVAYPYSPSFDLIYNKGYQSGYRDGESNGYDLGYDVGYNSGHNSGYWEGFEDGELAADNAAYYGIFQYLNAEVRMFAADGTLVGTCPDWLKGPNSVTFGPIYEYFLNTYKSGYYFELMIAAGHGYKNEVPLSLMNGCIVGKGDLSNYSLSNSFSVYGTNYFTQQYYAFSGYFEQMDAGFDPLPAYTLFFNQGSEDPDLSQIGFGYMTLRFDDIDIFKKLQFIYTEGFYNQGYNEGYSDGHINGMIEGYQPGYDFGYSVGKNDGEEVGFNNGIASGKEQGYSEGYSEGRVDGYNAGLSAADNNFLGRSIESFVFALFDAPVNTFMSVFNFEVLGFDIGGLVSFIFTVLVIVFLYRMVT